MPDLRNGKVIFEQKSNLRTIVKLSLDDFELSLMKDTDNGKNTTRSCKAHKIKNMNEYMYLESLFIELINYAIRTDNLECKDSRLDYTYNSSHREIYLINDKDGEVVPPWLEILKFLERECGVTSLNKGSFNNTRPRSSKSSVSKRQDMQEIEDEVRRIIDNLEKGSFTVPEIRSAVISNLKGVKDNHSNKQLYDKIWNVLKNLAKEGIIIKVDKTIYEK